MWADLEFVIGDENEAVKKRVKNCVKNRCQFLFHTRNVVRENPSEKPCEKPCEKTCEKECE